MAGGEQPPDGKQPPADKQPSADKQIAYKQESTPKWAEKLTAALTVQPVEDARRLRARDYLGTALPPKDKGLTNSPYDRPWEAFGDCPECTHQLRAVVPPVSRGSPLEQRVLVRCNCTMAHEGRPEDKEGCGRYGSITVKWQGEGNQSVGTVVEASPVTPGELYWEEQADKLNRGIVTSVRTAATQWTTGITSVTGVFSIVALIKGPEEIGDLEGAWSTLAGALALGAVVVALAAVGLAGLAAAGTPSVRERTAWQVRQWCQLQARRGKVQLKISRAAATLAVLVMVAAVAVTWLGPEAEQAEAMVRLSPSRGEPVCGELQASTGGNLAVKDSEGTVHSISAAGLRSLAVVSSCP